MTDKTTNAKETKAARLHKATYASDKRKGGYLVRVFGPHAGEFAGREVPVERRDGSESRERLLKVVWSGSDTETGKPAALYTFAPKPRELEELEF